MANKEMSYGELSNISDSICSVNQSISSEIENQINQISGDFENLKKFGKYLSIMNSLNNFDCHRIRVLLKNLENESRKENNNELMILGLKNMCELLEKMKPMKLNINENANLLFDIDENQDLLLRMDDIEIKQKIISIENNIKNNQYSDYLSNISNIFDMNLNETEEMIKLIKSNIQDNINLMNSLGYSKEDEQAIQSIESNIQINQDILSCYLLKKESKNMEIEIKSMKSNIEKNQYLLSYYLSNMNKERIKDLIHLNYKNMKNPYSFIVFKHIYKNINSIFYSLKYFVNIFKNLKEINLIEKEECFKEIIDILKVQPDYLDLELSQNILDFLNNLLSTMDKIELIRFFNNLSESIDLDAKIVKNTKGKLPYGTIIDFKSSLLNLIKNKYDTEINKSIEENMRKIEEIIELDSKTVQSKYNNFQKSWQSFQSNQKNRNNQE